MGWNYGYTIMENIIIDLYDMDVLTPDICKVILRPFHGTDYDEGGSDYHTSKDGKGFPQIVVELLVPDFKIWDVPLEFDDADAGDVDPEDHAPYAYAVKLDALIDDHKLLFGET